MSSYASIHIVRKALLFALTLFGASPCFGIDAYPSRPVRVIVTAAPGGVVDVTARIISQQLSETIRSQSKRRRGCVSLSRLSASPDIE
jgi:tripartite-type tricarboxylate transporter receptor subunit TctC